MAIKITVFNVLKGLFDVKVKELDWRPKLLWGNSYKLSTFCLQVKHLTHVGRTVSVIGLFFVGLNKKHAKQILYYLMY